MSLASYQLLHSAILTIVNQVLENICYPVSLFASAKVVCFFGSTKLLGIFFLSFAHLSGFCVVNLVD